MTAYLVPIGLLIVSNIFMTFAWYGHLGDMSRPLWLAVLIAWGIAFFEYCLAVPANRAKVSRWRAGRRPPRPGGRTSAATRRVLGAKRTPRRPAGGAGCASAMPE